MAKEVINNGSYQGDPSAESVFNSFEKAKNNFDEVYENISENTTEIDNLKVGQSNKTDKGGYTGTSQDLKDYVDGKTFEGLTTYQTLSDLQAVSPLPSEGTPAKVANDPTSTNNGYYSLVSSSWVKDSDLYESTIDENNTSKGVSGEAVFNFVGNELKNKLDVQKGTNLLDPNAFRYGYFYFFNSSTLQYNSNNTYGCTDYIPVSVNGLITEGAGTDAQGLASFVVFDENKNYIRRGNNTNQYTYQSGDFFVVFVYRVNSDLTFAESKSVVEGTSYSFEEYTEYKPLQDLEKRVDGIENISVKDVINGNPINYGNVSNFENNVLIQERNVNEDYLVFYKLGTGNDWIRTPEFNPTGQNLVYIKFKAEFTRVGTHNAGIRVYVADQQSTGGFFTIIQTIKEDGEYSIAFDPAFYTVYNNVEQFYVWISNESMSLGTDSLEVKLTNLRVEEYEDAVNGVNISGDNAKDLFESMDRAITDTKSLLTDTNLLVSPDGSKFELVVSNSGVLNSTPIIPNSGAFFGNSLLTGFGSFGMASSAIDKDYYYLITEYIKTLNPSFTYNKFTASAFEAIDDQADIDSTIQSVFLDNLTGLENLIVIQLGDNVNTPAKNALFEQTSLALCEQIRNTCPNARVFWLGMWYGSSERYQAIENACNRTGCKFISLEDLISDNTRNQIGNLSNIGTATRILNDVVSVVENTPTNITVTFTVSSDTYTVTLDVDSYVLNVDVLTYTGDFRIISSAGVASHPNDEGFRLIANKFLYQSSLTNSTEQYT